MVLRTAGRPHARFAEMSSFRAAIAGAYYDVYMQRGRAIWAFRNVANQEGDFDLLLHWSLMHALCRPWPSRIAYRSRSPAESRRGSPRPPHAYKAFSRLRGAGYRFKSLRRRCVPEICQAGPARGRHGREKGEPNSLSLLAVHAYHSGAR